MPRMRIKTEDVPKLIEALKYLYEHGEEIIKEAIERYQEMLKRADEILRSPRYMYLGYTPVVLRGYRDEEV